MVRKSLERLASLFESTNKEDKELARKLIRQNQNDYGSARQPNVWERNGFFFRARNGQYWKIKIDD